MHQRPCIAASPVARRRPGAARAACRRLRDRGDDHADGRRDRYRRDPPRPGVPDPPGRHRGLPHRSARPHRSASARGGDGGSRDRTDHPPAPGRVRGDPRPAHPQGRRAPRLVGRCTGSRAAGAGVRSLAGGLHLRRGGAVADPPGGGGRGAGFGPGPPGPAATGDGGAGRDGGHRGPGRHGPSPGAPSPAPGQAANGRTGIPQRAKARPGNRLGNGPGRARGPE